MVSGMNDKKITLYHIRIVVIAVIVMVFAFGESVLAVPKQKVFDTGQEGVNALVKAVREGNKEELLAIFGADANDLISSGDAVADKQKLEMFIKAYDEQNSVAPEGEKLVLIIGKNSWPFPIPIVKRAEKWVFDTNSGKEEMLNRRIGQNELDTIQVMLAIVDAEREYAMKDHDKNGILEYAQKFKSDPGKENGLYWETKEGQEPSPLGLFIAKAKDEGYFRKDSSEKPQPYHGYFYRILKAQGENAVGGAFDYIVNGKMIGGFAIVAYPAEYGNSGVMTFIVNHDGVVYQKDLGESTEKEMERMKMFDPDKTWTKEQ
ncbi:MAG: hypothetical protein A2Y12_01615 [Planctomycetes bacterium GWF2_42_9]|nr:MAG: hypothetical protein A2Y12_01615 [Planctomycetes bacterium GWF2_42_9]